MEMACRIVISGGALWTHPWKQREGSGTGPREKLEHDVVLVKSSANPHLGWGGALNWHGLVSQVGAKV